MSLWEIGTWAAIAVLVFGAVAVFAWFLVDVRKWFRSHPRR
jgi:hypothetical protein